ncbi:MAG: hypothetical protein ACLFWB_04995 [Armatimonadota bacterium]
MSRYTTFAAVAAAVVVVACCEAEFKVVSPAPPGVQYGETALISRTHIEPVIQTEADVSEVTVDGWSAVYHRWSADDRSKMREEIAARADAFEITMVRLVEPDVSYVLRYALEIPHEALDGVSVELMGRPLPAGAAEEKGNTFTATLGPDGVTNIQNLLYLRIPLPSGTIDLDTNCRGQWTGPTGVTQASADWDLERTAECWMLSTTDTKNSSGGLQEFKVRFTEALPYDVGDVHLRSGVRWTKAYQADPRINFGETELKWYEPCPVPDGELVRWDDPEAVAIQRDDRFTDDSPGRVEGVVPLDPSNRTMLEVPVARDGYYFFSMLVGAPDRALHGTTLHAGFRGPTEMPTVGAGDYGNWIVVAHAREGLIGVTFDGDFRIVTLALAPLMYEEEDFLFRRSWWLSTEFHRDDDLPK